MTLYGRIFFFRPKLFLPKLRPKFHTRKNPIRSNRVVRSKGQGRNYAHYQRRVYSLTDFLSSAKGRPFQSGLILGLFCTFLLFTLLPLWQHVKRRNESKYLLFRWNRNENNLFAYNFRRHSHSIQLHSTMGEFLAENTKKTNFSRLDAPTNHDTLNITVHQQNTMKRKRKWFPHLPRSQFHKN